MTINSGMPIISSKVEDQVVHL